MYKKRGQVTIFVIVAILIVALGILLYLFYPKMQTISKKGVSNPYDYIQTCLKDGIKNEIRDISLQGGELSPTLYYLYNNSKINYLCYTNEYYKKCVVQQPMIKKHIQDELTNSIKGNVSSCFNSMKEFYEKKGYQVSLKPGAINVQIIPKKIIIELNYSFELTKEETRKYKDFKIEINNDLYKLLGIGESIVEYETTYGDCDIAPYMIYYHDLNVQKKKQIDGTKIYIIENINTGDKFQFASRSIAWPPGFKTP